MKFMNMMEFLNVTYSSREPSLERMHLSNLNYPYEINNSKKTYSST